MKNCLITLSEKILLRKRSVIGTVNDELKKICQVEYSRHGSFCNFLSNMMARLIAYSFLPKKLQIKFQIQNSNQIYLFLIIKLRLLLILKENQLLLVV